LFKKSLRGHKNHFILKSFSKKYIYCLLLVIFRGLNLAFSVLDLAKYKFHFELRPKASAKRRLQYRCQIKLQIISWGIPCAPNNLQHYFPLCKPTKLKVNSSSQKGA